MESLLSIKHILKKSNFMCNLELKDACIFLHSSVRGLKEIYEVLLEKQSISVHLLLFRLGTNTQHFYEIFDSISSLPSSTRYSIKIYLEEILFIGRSVEETLVHRQTLILLFDKSEEICNISNTNKTVLGYKNRFHGYEYLTPRREF